MFSLILAVTLSFFPPLAPDHQSRTIIVDRCIIQDIYNFDDREIYTTGYLLNLEPDGQYRIIAGVWFVTSFRYRTTTDTGDHLLEFDTQWDGSWRVIARVCSVVSTVGPWVPNNFEWSEFAIMQHPWAGCDDD